GHLQLIVEPSAPILDTLDVWKTQYQFLTKSLKPSKTGTEAKLSPPESRRFARLKSLTATLTNDDVGLKIQYAFELQKFDGEAGSLSVKVSKTTVEQTLGSAERLSVGAFDKEKIQAGIETVLRTVGL